MKGAESPPLSLSASSSFSWDGLEPLEEAHREKVSEELQDFLALQASQKPVAVVSSGGTVAYLEHSSVRQLDNFSTGTRGATAVEILLHHGYAVIHLWRQDSVAPFVGTTLPSLLFGKNDMMPLEKLQEVVEIRSRSRRPTDKDDDDDEDSWLRGRDGSSSPDGSGCFPQVRLHRRWEDSSQVLQTLQDFQELRPFLHTIPFVTVDDYLQILPLVLTTVHQAVPLPPLVFLAAAVSDYFVPLQQRSREKISQSGNLTLVLSPVPKILAHVKTRWCPSAMLVTFKLETDPAVLRKKAISNLQKYQCDLVIGNLLQTRYETVTLYSSSSDDQDDDDDDNGQEQQVVVTKSPQDVEGTPAKVIAVSARDSLEEALLQQVMERHYGLVARHGLSWARTKSEWRQTRRAALVQKQQWLKWERWWKRSILHLSGSLLGMALSFGLSKLYYSLSPLRFPFLPRSSRA